jgi:hypothetical protein
MIFKIVYFTYKISNLRTRRHVWISDGQKKLFEWVLGVNIATEMVLIITFFPSWSLIIIFLNYKSSTFIE